MTSTKFQTCLPDRQVNPKFQNSSTKPFGTCLPVGKVLVIGYWSLFGFCFLGFGISYPIAIKLKVFPKNLNRFN